MTAENANVRNCDAGVFLDIPDVVDREDSTFTLGCLRFTRKPTTLFERLRLGNRSTGDTIFIVDRLGEKELPGIVCSNIMCTNHRKI